MARFTKKGKLARDRKIVNAPVGVKSSVGDLLTIIKLKNTDAAKSFT